MENKPIIQKFRTVESSSLERAIRYYKIVSAVNYFDLTVREVQLIAFTAIKGNISYSSNKQEFCDNFGSSTATINNMTSKLRKIGIFVKESGKVKVNPKIVLDFSKPVALLIALLDG